MKRFLLFLLAIILLPSCMEEPSEEQSSGLERVKFKSGVLTKSENYAAANPADSLYGKSQVQSDLDNLMIDRIVYKDGKYVLLLQRQAAIFLGIPEDMYDKYLIYVDSLNGIQ